MNRSLSHRIAAALAAVLVAYTVDAFAQAAAPGATAPAKPASTELGQPLERVIAIVNDEARSRNTRRKPGSASTTCRSSARSPASHRTTR
jgi:hypothetical protein